MVYVSENLNWGVHERFGVVLGPCEASPGPNSRVRRLSDTVRWPTVPRTKETASAHLRIGARAI